jgi:hypothetical protein
MRVNWLPALFLGSLLVVAPGCKFGKPDDAAITTDIKAKMFSEPALKSASVDVSSKDGIVTLSGQVPDDSARLAAYKIATEEKGVTKVNDQMTIQAAQAMPEPPPAPEPRRERSKPKRPTRATEPAPAPSSSPASTSAAENTTPASAPSPATPPPPQPRTVTIPANTIVTVRTIDNIDSATNRAGEVFRASLDAPIVADDRVVIPSGADAFVKLVNASSAGRFAGRSELTLELNSIVYQGRTYNVVTSDVKQSGASRGKNTAAKVGGGAALGALIGAVAGGGKGAAIGAAVGGGAGTGVQIFTKGQQVKIPSETRLDFTLQQPFDVTYIPGKTSHHRSSGDSQPSSDQP